MTSTPRAAAALVASVARSIRSTRALAEPAVAVVGGCEGWDSSQWFEAVVREGGVLMLCLVRCTLTVTS